MIEIDNILIKFNEIGEIRKVKKNTLHCISSNVALRGHFKFEI